MIAPSKVQAQRRRGPIDGWTTGTETGRDGSTAPPLFTRSAGPRFPRDAEILEVGPGVGNPTSAFLSSLWTVHGLDIDPAAARNPSLRSFHVLSGSTYPFPDETFGAVVSDYVVEHVENPSEHLREVFRVLVPGGVYALRTPNRLSLRRHGGRRHPALVSHARLGQASRTRAGRS